MKKAIVCGGTGFIGQHLVKRLLDENYEVRVIDKQEPEFPLPGVDAIFTKYDLASSANLPAWWFYGVDEVYQLAAEVGGLGFIHDHANDVLFLRNNARINMNVLHAVQSQPNVKVFFASSACVYPSLYLCPEMAAYPAQCDNEYAWEKLYSERLYAAYAIAGGVQVRIARFHNTYGPYHCFEGGREKAPAAICRKVAAAAENDSVEVWGDGQQTRSFMYIDDAVEGIRRLMNSDFVGPVNIGSSERVTVDQLTDMVIEISGKNLTKKHVKGEQGVRGRNSDNTLIKKALGWEPLISLYEGLQKTYPWVKEQVDTQR